MLRSLLCCLLLLSPDSGPQTGATATAADSRPDILQSSDSSTTQTFADNAQGDDPQLVHTGSPALFIPDGYSRTPLWQSFNVYTLPLFLIRAPPTA
ncbi:hypothetical protein [Thalassolituus hydrocarboniclasticus]|uniref:Uncharacterized protein n=1 Tax=Thalassolituus hydrocarboniclasticus TaxID=2742796 RepID=A0ABY6ADA8_9GAMM|nr:hypothetical protein [Thalassolituus hydrocarboniclasticus]UXD88627.1 hypothetical protein HUF19_14835 [Thalassolituus hydrocarboniclasticus]